MNVRAERRHVLAMLSLGLVVAAADARVPCQYDERRLRIPQPGNWIRAHVDEAIRFTWEQALVEGLDCEWSASSTNGSEGGSWSHGFSNSGASNWPAGAAAETLSS